MQSLGPGLGLLAVACRNLPPAGCQETPRCGPLLNACMLPPSPPPPNSACRALRPHTGSHQDAGAQHGHGHAADLCQGARRAPAVPGPRRQVWWGRSGLGACFYTSRALLILSAAAALMEPITRCTGHILRCPLPCVCRQRTGWWRGGSCGVPAQRQLRGRIPHVGFAVAHALPCRHQRRHAAGRRCRLRVKPGPARTWERCCCAAPRLLHGPWPSAAALQQR